MHRTHRLMKNEIPLYEEFTIDLDCYRRTWQIHEDKIKSKKMKKGRSIMQRLSNWFEDHLPLRKRDNLRRSERRKTSKSVIAPRMRYSVNNIQKQNDQIINQMPFAGNGPNSMTMSMMESRNMFDDGYTDQRMHHSYFDDSTVNSLTRHPSNFPSKNLSQSFSSAYSSCRASKIRTNPWIRERSSFRQPNNSSFCSPSIVSRSMYSAPSELSTKTNNQNLHLKPPPSELIFSSMDRTSQLRVKSLDESTCSSGYGSQDSSPESSVHSPDWQQLAQKKKQVEDKAIECRSIDVDEATMQNSIINKNNFDDDHVYHELETLQRLSLLLEERASSSDISPQPTNEKFSEIISRNSSPIYATPYDSHRNSLSSENPFEFYFEQQQNENLKKKDYENSYARIQPLSIESPFFRQSIVKNSDYSVPMKQYAPEWHCPPPPPLENNKEIDFLAELDKQIAELQIQSDAVRHLVEQAKGRQELRERTRLLCMEHINELRKMRWFMRNNFELCL